MINLIRDFWAALITHLQSSGTNPIPFKLAWTRHRHLRYGHVFSTSKKLATYTLEHHEHSDTDMVFRRHFRQCECGLTFVDEGLEYREGSEFRKLMRRIEASRNEMPDV